MLLLRKLLKAQNSKTTENCTLQKNPAVTVTYSSLYGISRMHRNIAFWVAGLLKQSYLNACHVSLTTVSLSFWIIFNFSEYLVFAILVSSLKVCY